MSQDRGFGSLLFAALGAPGCTPPPHSWSAAERTMIASLSLSELEAPPADPSNAVSDDPNAAELGQRLFFDPRLSGPGTVSCATCHQPDRGFTDGLALPLGGGPRHTPTVVGTAYNDWFFWDGRRDSAWAQALSPLENAGEHGATRLLLVHTVAAHHREPWERVFGPLPDLSDTTRFPPSAGPSGTEAERAAWEAMSAADRETINQLFAGIGKAIAAYERGLAEGPSRFDTYAAAVARGDMAAQQGALSDAEARGLRLFLGDARCVDCHHGPRFTNGDFHNTRLPSPQDAPVDMGRSKGVRLALEDPFRCDGPYSDAGPDDCQTLRFAPTEGTEWIAAMKTPSLRSVGRTAPYMHRGQLADLAAVVAHYNQPLGPEFGPSAVLPLDLSADEQADLVAFLGCLDGAVATPVGGLAPNAPVRGAGSPGTTSTAPTP